jgi:hypothetical protein
MDGRPIDKLLHVILEQDTGFITQLSLNVNAQWPSCGGRL